MNKKMQGIVVFAVMVLLGGHPPAEAKDALKIGIVDVKKVFTQYSGTKTAQQAMATEVKLKEAEVGVKEEKIKKLKQELKEKKLLMTDDVKKKKQQEIDSELQSLQEYVIRLKQSLQGKETDLVENIVIRIANVAKSMAGKKGYDVVLEKNAVFYGGEDITVEVIKAMEEQGK